MRNRLLTKNYSAETTVPAYRIVKFGGADGTIALCTSATDKSIGANDRMAFAAIGDRGDVARIGISEVEYGGIVAAGDPLTSDAVGRAVVPSPAVGSNVRVIGFAEVAGVLGDIGSLNLSQGLLQG